MSETTQSTPGDEPWSEYAEELNKSFFEAFEQNMQMQTEFLDSWRNSLNETAIDETMVEGMAGTSRAYEVWMEAAEAQFDLVDESLRGEEVELEAFRDVAQRGQRGVQRGDGNECLCGCHRPDSR